MGGWIDMLIAQIRWDEEEVDGLKDQWRYIITLKQSHLMSITTTHILV